ncbi:hypothetical protein GEMRC1_002780 [Eukaryota sp. GEM-RC1]
MISLLVRAQGIGKTLTLLNVSKMETYKDQIVHPHVWIANAKNLIHDLCFKMEPPRLQFISDCYPNFLAHAPNKQVPLQEITSHSGLKFFECPECLIMIKQPLSKFKRDLHRVKHHSVEATRDFINQCEAENYPELDPHAFLHEQGL